VAPRYTESNSRPNLSKPLRNLDPPPLLRIHDGRPAFSRLPNSFGPVAGCPQNYLPRSRRWPSELAASICGGRFPDKPVGSRRGSGPRRRPLLVALELWRQPSCMLLCGSRFRLPCTPAQHRRGETPRRPRSWPEPPATCSTAFCGGPTSRMRHAASLGGAEAPGRELIPSSSWCVGLGKNPLDARHRPHYRVRDRSDARVVLRLPVVGSLKRLIQAIREGRDAENSATRYPGRPILILVDDIQFIEARSTPGGVSSTPQCPARSAGRQDRESASDAPAARFRALQERLISAFSNWLIADIRRPPIWRPRMAILQRN